MCKKSSCTCRSTFLNFLIWRNLWNNFQGLREPLLIITTSTAHSTLVWGSVGRMLLIFVVSRKIPQLTESLKLYWCQWELIWDDPKAPFEFELDVQRWSTHALNASAIATPTYSQRLTCLMEVTCWWACRVTLQPRSYGRHWSYRGLK